MAHIFWPFQFSNLKLLNQKSPSCAANLGTLLTYFFNLKSQAHFDGLRSRMGNSLQKSRLSTCPCKTILFMCLNSHHETGHKPSLVRKQQVANICSSTDSWFLKYKASRLLAPRVGIKFLQFDHTQYHLFLFSIFLFLLTAEIIFSSICSH